MTAYFDFAEVQVSDEEALQKLKQLLKLPDNKDPIPIEALAKLPVQWFGGADLIKNV